MGRHEAGRYSLWRKSGRGLPQSKSWRVFQRIRAARSVVGCGSPQPLGASVRRQTLIRSAPPPGADQGLDRQQE